MHPFEKKILKNCRNHQLVKSGERVVAGVSGGPDSMAMLYALVTLSDLLEISIFVAHANHGLRPLESSREEKFVREQSDLLGLPYQVSLLGVRDLAKDKGLSFEHAARELRYNFFDEAGHLFQTSKIAVAHNSDDQAEEVLLRLLRGTGSKGLAGMEMKRGNKVIRPLLNIYRTEIMQYLQDKNIPYMLDSSNMDRRYRRNQVRLDLLPKLAADFNPNIKQVLCQTASILQDENKFLEKITDQAYEQTVIETCDEKGEKLLNVIISYFTKLDTAIKRRLLEKAILALNRKPGYKQIESIMGAVLSAPHVIHLAGGLRVFKDENFLRLSFPGGQTNNRQNFIETECVRFEILIPKPGIYAIPEINSVIEIESLTGHLSEEQLKTPDTDHLDYGKVSFPLKLRNRHNGDSFIPLGCSGRKSVGKFLSDLKMPIAVRRLTPVLLSDKKIVALPGIRISDEFQVTANTGKILKVSMCRQDKYLY